MAHQDNCPCFPVLSLLAVTGCSGFTFLPVQEFSVGNMDEAVLFKQLPMGDVTSVNQL